MFKYVFILLTLLFAAASLAKEHQSIEVFTMHAEPVQAAPNIQVYYLDDIDRLQNILNQKLRTTYEIVDINQGIKKAIKKARDFISRNQQQYLKALSGIAKAQRYGITKIPAIVIDGKYEILGTTDINQALIKADDYIIFNRDGK